MPELDTVETTTQTAVETAAAAPQTTQPETGPVSRAEFDALQKALKEANKEAAARRKQLEAFEAEKKARAEAEMTEAEKLKHANEELAAKVRAHEQAEMRRAAAAKAGLPETLASRLQGETPEALEADAKALLETLPKPTKPSPGILPTNPANASQAETREQRNMKLYGNSGGFVQDVFNKVGGVTFKE